MNKKDAFRYAKQRGISEDHVSSLENTDVWMISHSADECAADRCTLHNRSDHSMRSFPQSWRSDRGIMERICNHGVGHPDPDNPWPSGSYQWIHGCDGCGHDEEEAE